MNIQFAGTCGDRLKRALREVDKRGLAENRTRITGFKVLGANRYTTKPYFLMGTK
ncbi:hypothetical protein K7432_013407, partial [Basidiobolus ranarum]